MKQEIWIIHFFRRGDSEAITLDDGMDIRSDFCYNWQMRLN